jgi:Leucine-rich repeat (LRR) protein
MLNCTLQNDESNKISSLTKLQLTSNSISSISNITGFESVESIFINNNKISDWKYLFALSGLKKLKELRYVQNR